MLPERPWSVKSGSLHNWPRRIRTFIHSRTQSLLPGRKQRLNGTQPHAEFTAGHARHVCGLAVARDAVEGEPWHAHVIVNTKPKVRRLLPRSSIPEETSHRGAPSPRRGPSQWKSRLGLREPPEYDGRAGGCHQRQPLRMARGPHNPRHLVSGRYLRFVSTTCVALGVFTCSEHV